MSNTKFTPGPWLASWTHSSGYGKKQGWHVYDAKKVAFVLNIEGTMADEANANLIAAAPDMYEALKAAWEEIGNLRSIENLKFESPAMAKIGAALNKANGL